MADAKKDEKPAADKGADKADKAAAPKKKGGGMIGFILMMICFGAAFPFVLPSLVLLVGMFPTLVMLFVDSDSHKSSTQSVGMMNAAGILPFLIELWQKGQTMENVFLILRQPETWLVMLGAAGIGQMIVFAVPQAIASMALARAETRLGLLKDNLEKLKNTWGPDVATTKPIAKLTQGED